ncbi:MAG: alanine--tRNA ligase, partial [Euryarchaeota archaeon]|nr:alanine--tRNA ligase [Euryarchaeota archaeon]
SADSALLNEYSKIAGMTNAKTAADVRKIREMTASRIGISYEELMRDLRPLEDIYVACDHSRALAFLINDGVVPSNVREGYFARLLVRRGLRAIRSLGIDVPLSDIVNRQIDFFAPVFPEMSENREDILTLVQVEEERYRETLARGRSLVSRITKDLKPGERVSTEKLIELYDSHGLNPEIVKEFTTIEVDIPDDFYIQVSARHEKPEADEVKGTSLPDNLPETKMLFYEDPRKLEFEAIVLATAGGGVILDQTAFYPEGGGQEWDTGTLGGSGVTKVLRIGNAVIHLLDGEVPKEGSKVGGSVDRERRLQLMRHHTAAHLINGISRKILGNHVWQAGAHKSEMEGRLDITHYESLTADQKNAIEREVNRVVLEDLPVKVQLMPRVEAERLHGFRLYQGGAVPGGTIRVVEVPGLDAEACGGLHCERTSQVGLVRIPRTKRIQDGVVRIEFLVGMPAVDSMMEERGELDRLASELGVPLQDAVARALEYRELSRKQGRELRKVSDALHLSDSVEVIKDAEKIDGISLVIRETKEGEDPMSMLRALTGNPKVVAVITAVEGTGLKVFVARSSDVEIDCRAVLKEIMKVTGGGGGGKKEFAQGGGGDPTRLPEAIGTIPKIIRRLAKDETGK